MVMPNNSRRTLDELLAYGKTLHLELFEWAETAAERTVILGAMQTLEVQLQVITFLQNSRDE